jgi:hypothetical protein
MLLSNSGSDIPQMFPKIPQFFSLSFFLKIALPIQVYVLEASQLLGYVPLMKALNLYFRKL